MPFSSDLKTFTRTWQFVDQFVAGEDADRADFDVAFDDLANGMQVMFDYLDDRIDTYLPDTGTTPASVSVENFSGDGVTKAFILTNATLDDDAVFIFVDGIYQRPDTYSLSGTSLVFSEAPPSGSDNVQVVVAQSVTAIRTEASEVTLGNGQSLEAYTNLIRTAALADADATIASDNETHHRAAFTATRTLTLPAATVGASFTFDVTAAQALRLLPAAGENFIGKAVNKYMESSTVGSSVTVRCHAVGEWFFLRQGTWADQP